MNYFQEETNFKKVGFFLKSAKLEGINTASFYILVGII